MVDIQRRRNKEKDIFLDQAEEIKDRSKMPASFWKSVTLKNCVITCIFIVVVSKFWQFLTYKDPRASLLPPNPNKAKQKWPYKDNPQGITEQELNKLLSDIKLGKDIRSDTSEEDDWLPDQPTTGVPYTSPGSLTFKDGIFSLEGKPLRIMSGAMHYFRVMPEYWEDRMLKMKACGLNTLETYVAWNHHEDVPGTFNFDGILDLRKYIQIAQKVGLHVILRPGPYICSEWDFGGLPAWLLKDPDMKVRSNYPGYTEAVERYFGKLIPLVADLQYAHGGPIIAVQVENEFGSYSSEVEHLLFLKQLLLKHGIKEMLFTSDGKVGGNAGFFVAPFYTEALPTVNFKEYKKGKSLFKAIKSISKDFPLVVMEFWSGWFDHWERKHAFSDTQVMASDLQEVLKDGASVNFYMFHGGTNFGFSAGANWFKDASYKPDVTSYDYIAPLSEAGDLTPKYEVARALIQKYVLEPQGSTELPDPPLYSPKANYGSVTIDGYLPLENILSSVKYVSSISPVPMEMLSIHGKYGQNYGYTLYRAFIPAGKKIKFTVPAQDRVQVIVNGIQIGLFTWFSKYWEVDIPVNKMADENILDILVEHHGRVNYVAMGANRFNEERKGISGDILLDGKPIKNWKIYPLELKEPSINRLVEEKTWKIFANWKGISALYKGTLTINATPRDTFINMKGWEKGVVFINGFNLGRYWSAGPQKTLYVPAPVLKTGKNTVVVFELHKGSHSVVFQDTHILS